MHHRPSGNRLSCRFAACTLVLIGLGAGAVATPLQAHHSFAVHYDASQTITQEGDVAEFRFTNPHGILLLDVTTADGTVER